MGRPTDDDVGLVRSAVRDYAERRIRPIAAGIDGAGEYPLEIVAELGELGLLGIGFPEEYGGSGGTKLAFAVAVEEVYRVAAGVAASAFMSKSTATSDSSPTRRSPTWFSCWLARRPA
jgi:short/branched chain acyl-CoA dehydrogenase